MVNIVSSFWHDIADKMDLLLWDALVNKVFISINGWREKYNNRIFFPVEIVVKLYPVPFIDGPGKNEAFAFSVSPIIMLQSSPCNFTIQQY